MRLSGTKTGSINQYNGLGDQLYDIAGERPTLDLNFAGMKSLKDQTTGNSLVTHSRSSNATYVGSDGLIKDATTDEARFDHDPTTGESLGLLVEGQRTNLAAYSEQVGQWTKVSSTITNNATTAPDGSLTADKVVANTDDGQHRVQMSAPVVSGTSYTFSVYVKADEYNKVQFQLGSGGFGTQVKTTFYLATGTATSNTVGTNTTHSITAFPNGWYRCTLSSEATGSTNVVFAIRMRNETGLTSFAGDGVKGLFCWGVQIEASSFPTSYIRTPGNSTVTRSPDLVAITGSNFTSFFDQTKGTTFASYTQNTVKSGLYPSIFAFRPDPNPGSVSTNEVFMNSNGGYGLIRNVHVDQAIGGYSGISVESKPKTALAFAANDFKGFTNGSAYLTDTAGTLFSPMEQMLIGQNSDTDLVNTTISRIAYWPKRLSDESLKGITE